VLPYPLPLGAFRPGSGNQVAIKLRVPHWLTQMSCRGRIAVEICPLNTTGQRHMVLAAHLNWVELSHNFQKTVILSGAHHRFIA
jgi:hypothetical protein